MDNRDIFQFDFVDRNKQRDIINLFLSDSSCDNYLWMNGDSGIGKSFFIENRIDTHKDDFTHINICLPSETENINCVNEIIKELQYNFNADFITFLQQNYHSILNMGKKTVRELIKIKNLSFSWFFDILYNTDFVFKNNNENTVSGARVIQNYIDNILKKNKLLLVMDNFTNCDQKSLVILKSIFPQYIGNPCFKCIFVTTSSTLSERENIQVFLSESLPIKKMSFEKLDNVKYFFSILDSIFEIDEEIYDNMDNIYNICNGNPETLKSLIRKIYINDGINIPKPENTKAQIKKEILNKYLIEKSFDIDNNDLTEDERFVVQVFLGFGSPISLNILQSCILYIHQKMFNSNLWTISIVNNILSSLQRKNILANKQKIEFVHDRTFWGLSLLLDHDLNKPLISFHFYEFLLNNRNLDIDTEYLLAYHAYIAQTNNWSEENYQFGLKKYNLKKYSDAVSIFNRLISKQIKLDCSQKIVICNALYEIGYYNEAKSILNQSDFSESDQETLFAYNYLFGKIENILLNKREALKKYNEALKYALNRETEIQILNLKHLALLETPEGKENAKNIFNSIALHLTDEEKKMLPVCNLLRNCNQFYTGEKAEEFFKLAKEIAIEQESYIDVAYVENNYGLELFRTGNKDDAFRQFSLSYRELQDLKYHEAAYPLNNMAVYEIFKDNYSEALEYLLEAKYVNQSLYADLAIKLHMMTCYRELKDEKNCRKYMQKLEDYLFHHKISDYNIVRKLSINLCITYLYYDEFISANSCLSIGLPYFSGTISEYRGYKLDNKLNNISHSLEHAMKSNDYYTTLKFEPWIITLSHD